MVIVSGIDENKSIRMIEFCGSKQQAETYLTGIGWTNLMFF